MAGGTKDAGKVSANGNVYTDAATYTLVKIHNGHVLACYRQVNDSDVLILLELGDYKTIVQ